MAILINGNGNKAIWAAQDADLIAAICGNVTSIAEVGNQFAATQEDASTIGLADGVIITKEGRRIQLDTGAVDLFTIPTGTAGVTSYYIIGYKLSQQSDTSQICETFVQKMNSASETIDEDTFKGGATEVYVSCYRVTQDGLNIDTIEGLLPLMGHISGGGGGMELDYSNAIEHTYTGTQTDTTFTSSTNGVLFYSMQAPKKLTIRGKKILESYYGSGGNNGTVTADHIPISNGDPVVFSCWGDGVQGCLFTEVPYKQ